MEKETITVIIPAYNEERQIAGVLEPIKKAKIVDEIIVVDDGSTDKTAGIAKAFGVRVISQKNGGKGAAMQAGLDAAAGKIIVFIDADLIGLEKEHINALVGPFLTKGNMAMTVGKFVGGNIITFFGQRIFLSISGQRGIRKEYFKNMPSLSKVGYGAELALTKYARQNRLKTKKVALRGINQLIKEQKIGAVRGSKERWLMYWDIFREIFKK